MGLRGTKDYSDTIFSIGAELLGFFDMILIPGLIYLEWLDNCFKQAKHYNIRYIRFILFPIFFNRRSYLDWFYTIYS